MTSLIDTITTYEDQLLETLSSAQAPAVEYVSKAVDAIEEYLPESRPALPVAELVDSQFKFAKKALDTQHKFVKAIVGALAPVFNDKPVAKKATRSTVKAA
ncbi:MAG: hypothetical protein QOH68_1454 [Nocardioidaceae bacterium]|jgi:hypothetical protein|nr:hypothetical protein [Nocardioidaceae bacterium]